MLTVVVFILILSILVMLHELGHFIAAKRAGIGVEEFGFGLPPRIWGKKIGETIYSINWLPFGGFVKLVGEDDAGPDKNKKLKDEEKSRNFAYKSLPIRMRVVLAGVFMNLVLAVLIFYVVLISLGFKVSVPLIVDHKFAFANQSKQVLVTDVAADSAAAKAGLNSGESIVSAANVQIGSIEQLQVVIRSNENKEVQLVLENPTNNKQRTVSVVPVHSDQLNAPAIGVGLDELVVLNYKTPMQKLFSGITYSYNTVVYSGKIFGRLIGYSIAHHDITPVKEGVSGPVGIAKLTGEAISLGPISVLQLMALLSLNLAVINVLPIPALDGGRFFFLVVEAVIRRRVYPQVEKWAHTIGFAVLIGLIVLVTFNDILKLLH
ncbi:MAG TPA: site-2 protease family protein [Candidatus Saccharimonadales bacterium]|nr:site-2 protease family protein [Candidatus Saccharimonadales bacterium]